MSERAKPACRLYAILARDGRSAVVFRRGPSRKVLLLRWWLGSDRIEQGQWFRGRIYERRSDLSPDGELLVYFAAKYRAPYETWTAVSRPPYFSALALWPKGDAWGGGGLFQSQAHLGLNHPPQQMTLAPHTQLPARIRVNRYAAYAGRGEDNPIQHDRAIRDGWRLISPGRASDYRAKGRARWTFDEPEVYEREQPAAGNRRKNAPLMLRRSLHAVAVTQGPWYDESFLVIAANGQPLRQLPNCDWADWQSTGDLLVAMGGALYRIPRRQASATAETPLAGARMIADLSAIPYAPLPPPQEATCWPQSRRPARQPRGPKL